MHQTTQTCVKALASRLSFLLLLLVLLLLGHALSGAQVAGQPQTETGPDGIGLEDQLAAGIGEGNCADNDEVMSLFTFLSGGLADTDAATTRNASSGPTVTWSLADLCSLQGVGCRENCDYNLLISYGYGQNLLDPVCGGLNTADADIDTLILNTELSQTSVDLDLGAMLRESENKAMALISFCVDSLNLASRGLIGDLGSLSGLTSLRSLNVTSNQITGNVADLDRMAELNMVDLSFNKIAGTLDGLNNPALVEFHGNENFLTGNFSGLKNAPYLKYLDVRRNAIEGTIDYFRVLPFLQYAYINDNQLEGNVSVIQELESLLMLSAGNNSLSGALPDQSTINNLVVLMLQNNSMESVGDALSKMKNLQFADLSSNKLGDNINYILRSANHWLGALDLKDNDLYGVIESEILTQVPNLEFLFMSENPKVAGRLIPDLNNFEQIQVTTVDQFLYYVVDRNVFASIETVQSNYFRIQTDYLSTDSNCSTVYSEVHENTTMQEIRVSEHLQTLFYCFYMPRGKFLIDVNTNNILPFNISYFANIDSCGINANQQSGGKAGHLILEDEVTPIALPIGTCNDPAYDNSKVVSMTIYINGDYGDAATRGYIQDYNFEIDVIVGPKTSMKYFTPYLIMIVLIVVIVIVLAVMIGIAVSAYVTFQKQISYNKMKKSAEAAFVKTRKHSKITNDKDACVVFTDIQNSTMLRDASSQLYNNIILVHDGTVRKLAAKLGALELATEGDGFVLWFESVPNATVFCMELQQELMQVSWSPSVKKLCNKAYGQNAQGNQQIKSVQSDSESNASRSTYSKIEKSYVRFLSKFRKEEKCFNGPRVRCGVHTIRAGENTVENIALGVYSFSGPDFEKGRIICDMGHGGQVLVSAEAQQVILDNLNATQFPQIWHWGGWTFDSDEKGTVHHIYEVAPSQGMVKKRNFEGLRGHIHLAYPPGVRFSSRQPPSKDVIIVCATVKHQNVSKAAIEIADRLFCEMQQRFWGWHITPDGAEKGSSFRAIERRSLSFLGMDEFRTRSFGVGSNFGPSSQKSNQRPVQPTKKWYFAFAKPEDALRFALCCQLELVYAQWPKKIKSRFDNLLTADKAPLWNGMPVAFAVHICKFPKFESKKTMESTATNSIRMNIPSKSKLELCNPSKRQGLFCNKATLSETLGILDHVALDGQVVVTSSLIQSMSVPISNIGDPVVEHLGRVQIKSFLTPVDVYQVLPVELAARSFPTLSQAMPEGSLLSRGARSAPTPRVGLTFVFMYTISSDSASPTKEGNETFSSNSIFDDQRLHILLKRYNGYLVDEVSLSNMVFAFESVSGAVCFCVRIQRSMAICKSRLKECGESFELSDDSPSMDFDSVNLLRMNHEHNKNLKVGLASVETQQQVVDVFEGIDSKTGRRRYGTPILNLASRVAKSASVGQILMVAKNPGMKLWGGQMLNSTEGEEDKVDLLELGYFKLKGFGDKPRFVYEVRSGDPILGCLNLESGITDSDYMSVFHVDGGNSSGNLSGKSSGILPSRRLLRTGW
jgi:class 3 adenylate cyclase